MRFRTGRVFSFVGAAALLMPVVVGLSGCGNFFVCEGKSSCPSSGTGGTGGTGTTGTGDYAYVTNDLAGSDYVSEYTVGTGALTAISGSPFNLNYVPVAIKVSPNNNFLYVAAAPGTNYAGIWMYTIGSTGALSGGTEVVSRSNIAAMDISPDGNFLYTIDSGTGLILSQYGLNTSTGAVTTSQTFTTPGGSSLTGCALELTLTPVTQSCSVAVSPSGNYVGVSLGATGGGTSTVIYPYSSSLGITQASYTGAISSGSALVGDFSLAFDNNGYLYIARTAALASYGGLSGNPSAGTAYTSFTTSDTPRGVVLSTGYNYVYTADEGSSHISAFGISNGALTALNSTIQGPASVSALGVDRSGVYLLAAGYNATNGLQLFTITSAGLTAITTAVEPTSAQTSAPVLIAMTH
jgi:6-phosphogluconolactonase